jgi:anti-sigma factor (TIGR02949 family)
MICQEFAARLQAFVDGELEVDTMTAAQAHVSSCPECHGRADGERRFRALLRQQPQEVAPPELRARLLAVARRERRRAALRVWLGVPALATAAVLMAALLMTRVMPPGPSAPRLVDTLVDKHLAYAQIESPAEFTSSEPGEVAAWLRDRIRMRVPVPDYSHAGIRLVGARIAEADEQKLAYLLYEKGHMLMSVFMLPDATGARTLPGKAVSYRGHEYLTRERKSLRTVSWRDGQAVFSLVSMLDYDALLECADRLRAARARETRL